MNRKFLKRGLSTFLVLASVLTINFTNHGINTYASTKHDEKLVVQDAKGSITNSSLYTTQVPDDWNPETATDEELQKYDFPPRPKNKDELSMWKKLCSCKLVKPKLTKTNIKPLLPKLEPIQTNKLKSSFLDSKQITTSPSAIFNVDVSKGYVSDNWAGMVYQKPSYGVSGFWVVPEVSTDDQHPEARASQWVGIGGHGSKTLIQCGTATIINKGNHTEYYPWIELLGTDTEPNDAEISVNDQLTCEPGDLMYARVLIENMTDTTSTKSDYANGKHMYVTFNLFNVTKNKYAIIHADANSKDIPNSTEWIAERPTLINLKTGEETLTNYPVTNYSNSKVPCTPFGLCAYKVNKTDSDSEVVGIDSNSNIHPILMKRGNTTPYKWVAIPSIPSILYFESDDGKSKTNKDGFIVEWKDYN